jgi:hypothetical protein
MGRPASRSKRTTGGPVETVEAACLNSLKSQSNCSGQESFYTVAEVAEILKVSADKVTRMFEDELGVVDLGSPEKLNKRRYRVLRIPHAVFNRVIHKLRVQ